MLFSERRKLVDGFKAWADNNELPHEPFNVITWLDEQGKLKEIE